MAGRKRVRNTASKDMILKAAERVVTQRGSAHLTLDAVAREAGISKGGLLYNFPTKQSLIEGMILAHVDRFRKNCEALRAERSGPNSVICTLIRARKAAGVERGIGLAMLAGVAENPALLTPLRKEIRTTLDDIRKDAADPMVATLVWLAIDGLDFLELLDVSPFDEDERHELEAEMEYLIGAGSGQDQGCGFRGDEAQEPAGGSS